LNFVEMTRNTATPRPNTRMSSSPWIKPRLVSVDESTFICGDFFIAAPALDPDRLLLLVDRALVDLKAAATLLAFLEADDLVEFLDVVLMGERE